MTWRFLVAANVLWLASCSTVLQRPAAPATRPLASGYLSVEGKVAAPLVLDEKTFGTLPRAELHVKDHSGEDAVYTGVPLREILLRAGAPVGNNQLRGPNLRLYLLAEASDGYRVVFGLAELDADFAERNILVADRRNGQVLAAKDGPLRIVVPDEKRQARWIRQLARLTVQSADD